MFQVLAFPAQNTSGGYFTLSTQRIKPDYLVIHCTNAAPQFLLTL